MQLGEAFSSPLLVRIYDHFRVRTRPKLMPGSDKFVAKLAKIVNFPVKADGQRPRLIPDRLRPPGQIDDAQPPRARGKARRNERPFFIGTPMNDRAQHARKSGSAFAHRVASDNSANAAHARIAPFRSPESHNSLSRSMPQISAERDSCRFSLCDFEAPPSRWCLPRGAPVSVPASPFLGHAISRSTCSPHLSVFG